MWDNEKLKCFSEIVRFYANSRIMPVRDFEKENLLVKPIQRMIAAIEADKKEDDWWSISEQTLHIIYDVADKIWSTIENNPSVRYTLSKESIEIPSKYKTKLFDVYYIPIDEPMTWELLHTIAGKISQDCIYYKNNKE